MRPHYDQYFYTTLIQFTMKEAQNLNNEKVKAEGRASLEPNAH